MEQTQKLKLNLQHFASNNVKSQVFNPDNVMMHEKKDGTLMNEFTTPILQEVMENSKIMQLGKYEPMEGTEKKFTFWADKPGAYWVGEGQKIETSKATWVNATMRAFKLGVILPVTKEFLNYTYSQFFEEMKPMIAEAFYKKFDEAGILNQGNNPFGKSIAQSIEKTNKVIKGDFTQDNIIDLEALLEDDELEANAFISKTQNRSLLRKIVDPETKERIYDRNSDTLDGLPVVNLKSSNLKRGELITGDFDKLIYGIPQLIEYKIDETAQLSTVKNEDGTPVNLFEQDMVALRATMHVALHIADDKAFAKLVPADKKTDSAPGEV
ncbi:TPA: phage major capsid protein [Staphylococcus aureus]|uniref:phage major capsid protein n=1 Tax=Staphylococcus aureus TaxID=1280 RepID=UPI0005C5C4AC|nr:phage major capsid protein [Staphylococcus aureus]CAC5511003.1 Phage head protein/Phage major capsid protein [Staphylococcus aureus]CAC5519067.1 Phage head protein/Phage major capsid protein [Staphylococcus aureus]CAC5524545.1 Phage head protein/Phage major capsid protein [Staphylococcus aureus]CAC5528902.1 Phage head protein/Phage major capsid protein [Staphylococcus aureus]CAC5549786.1 Phage head protein/Phage major capsid protein [Staphylococcus aureus]